MWQTIEDLVDQVRAQIDEKNVGDIEDADILARLNRGSLAAAEILARSSEQLFWESTTFTSTAGTEEYDLPVEALGRRIEMLEVAVDTSTRQRLVEIPQSKTTRFRGVSAYTPVGYALKRNKIVLIPAPSTARTYYVHYTKAPYQWVLPQGRITSYSSGNNTIVVDTLGSSISTSVTGYAAYVNIIDYQTGDIKGTCQISAINTTSKQITMKSSGLTASTALGRTVSTSLPTDIAVDDFICLVHGTCVPEAPPVYTEYALQHAIVSLKRRLGEPAEEDILALQTSEKQLREAWVGRPQTISLTPANKYWSRRI